MSPHDHTSTSSRRFLPPSSSSAQPKDALPHLSSVHQDIKFRRSSQLSSASRFTQTPQIKSVLSKSKDDIETSFDGESSSPPLPSRSKFTSSTRPRQDEIDDFDDGTPTKKREVDFRAPNARGLRRTPIDFHATVRDSVEDVITPVPRKRRKVSASNIASNDKIRSSSISEDYLLSDEDLPDRGYGDEHKCTQNAAGPKLDQAPSPNYSSPSISPVVESLLVSSRFRMPSTTAIELRNHDRNATSTRHLFKALPSHLQSAGSVETGSDQALPDAFSPSRRRGKRDYVSSGAAETVRNWVLSLAAKESQAGHQQQSAQVHTESLHVSGVVQDRSGRCAVVQSDDDRTWLLIGQQGKQPPKDPGGQSVANIKSGVTVNLKGAATRWEIGYPESESKRQQQEPSTSVLNVSVLWDLVDKGMNVETQ